MGIVLGSNFTVNTALPLDDRIVVADNTARDAIAAGRRYEGLIVYSVAAASNYQLVGGILNANWTTIAGGGGSTTVVVQRFSGNAITTVFTLSSDPVTEENTQVYINGVYQQKDTYSFASLNITFTQAPPVGTNNIEVTYFTAFSIGSLPANSVGTSQLQDNSVTNAKMADDSVNTAELVNGAVTLVKMTGNYMESLSLPNVGITSTSYTKVTDSDITGFVHAGGDVEFGLTQGSTLGNEQEVRVLATASVDTVYMNFVVRDVTNSVNLAITRQGTRFATSSSSWILYFSPGCFTTTIRNLAAGTYNFELRSAVSTSNSAVFNNVKFYARGKK